MTLIAVGIALFLIGVFNQTPAVTNGATVLVFAGFALTVAGTYRVLGKGSK